MFGVILGEPHWALSMRASGECGATQKWFLVIFGQAKVNWVRVVYCFNFDVRILFYNSL